jgi:hypothetical protein
MKKITQNLRWLVTLLAMIVCTGAWAETSTVTASKVTSSSASWTGSANETWAVTVNGGATNQNVTNEFAQIGTKNSPSTSITFSTSGISETITKIEVECASYNGIGTVSATVGSEDFGTQEQSIPTWSSNSGGTVTFSGSASGEIVITMTNETGGRAMYIKSITVTYSSSGETPTPTPSITVDPATVNATAEETEGTLAISYENLSISDMTDFDIQYYDANNQELTTEPDWVEVLVAEAEGGENYVVSYVIDANKGEARTAYCKVYAMGDDDFVYSNLITINQAAPVIDYATLPFEFDGGKNDIENTNGLTHSGLGSDYNTALKLKFDDTDDWVLLKIGETPGKLSFDIKGNTFSGGTFTVQTSSDGETYTDLKTYTALGDTQSEEFDNLNSDVRYIKWIYTNKVSGNVALGNIALAEYGEPEPSITVSPTTIDVPAAGGDGTIDVTFTAFEPFSTDIQFYESDGTTETESGDWLYVEIDETTGNVNYLIEENTGEARTAYFKVYGLDEEMNELYSELITITQDEFVEPHEELTFVKVTSTDELVAGGEYIIIANYPEDSEGYYAMTTTQNTNNRGADGIYVSEDIAYIEPEHVQVITLEGDSEGWYFNVGDGYLYAASSSKNNLKTQAEADENAKATIEISSDGDATIVFQGEFTRNRLRFNNNDLIFSCYASGQQPVQLYKKVEAETAPSVTIGAAYWTTYVAETNVSFPSEVTAFTVETIEPERVTLGVVSAVKEGTPILVYSATPDTYSLELVNKNNCSDTSTNQLKAGPKTGDGATIYALANKDQGVGFYPVGNGIEVPAGKAYLEIPPTMSVKGFLALGGLADAINNIAVETANGTIFNIAGQKVQNITKGGLYIVNGKKVVVK